MKIKTYSLKELETILQRSRPTLFRYIKNGELKAVKIGNAWRVTEENLQAFLNGSEH